MGSATKKAGEQIYETRMKTTLPIATTVAEHTGVSGERDRKKVTLYCTPHLPVHGHEKSARCLALAASDSPVSFDP